MAEARQRQPEDECHTGDHQQHVVPTEHVGDPALRGVQPQFAGGGKQHDQRSQQQDHRRRAEKYRSIQSDRFFVKRWRSFCCHWQASMVRKTDDFNATFS